MFEVIVGENMKKKISVANILIRFLTSFESKLYIQTYQMRQTARSARTVAVAVLKESVCVLTKYKNSELQQETTTSEIR